MGVIDMAGRGPAPKTQRQRKRDEPEFSTLAAPAAGFRELHDDLLPGEDSWHPATLRWWSTWAESPLSVNLLEVDWCELEACAVLHHEFMRKRTFTLASELRLRVAKFGATPEDRMRLKIKVDPAKPDAATGGNVTNIKTRRLLLEDG